ncbi:MAG: FGGY family carbohydrate kinase [Mangrovicoccus sp.]
MKILAIDQSTTATAGFLWQSGAAPVCLFERAHKQIYPQPGWVEHDPEELLTNLAAALEAGVAAGADYVALANQGESCLAWDGRDGRPLGPVLVWQDSRTTARCAALARDAGAEIAARARLPVDPYFSASKLAWCLDHLPGARDLAQAGHLRLGTTDAFFRDRLGGRFETDLATASRTSLMALTTGAWDPELCRIFGVPLQALPRITACSGDLGRLGSLPLLASITDQQAALYGHGLRQPGDTKITFGTGAFALAVAGSKAPNYGQGALPTVAWQENGTAAVYALDGGVHTASAALNWARGLGLFDNFDQLGGYDGHALERGLAFVPALAGLACPHWVDGARGVWLGLGLDTKPAELMQALIEGIAYRSREVLEAMAQQLPLSGEIAIDGGMTQNDWICQTLANITGRVLRRAETPDATALGLALLAARSLGQTPPIAPKGRCFRPDPGFAPLPERFATAVEAAKLWSEETATAAPDESATAKS